MTFWDYVDDRGERREDKYRPRIAIKHIDSKRALKGFAGRLEPDETDLIPEGSTTGKPDHSYGFRGHFLDLRTLAFALTDRGHSLQSACDAFGVREGKGNADRHGVVSASYIDYNRQDVAATAALAFKLLEEYDRFDVYLQETQAYSPASLGKAHLRRMGIPPIFERQPNFPEAVYWLCPISLRRRAGRLPHPQSIRPDRGDRRSLKLYDGQRIDGAVEVRDRAGDQRRAQLQGRDQRIP